ncbi:MAG: pitrilysin family protein [Alphaproteobacteria bacterium]
MSHIQFTTLDNGLRVITDTVPDVHSVALGIWVNVGTRNEAPEYNGAAHMVEHMLFKGTPTRTTQQIAEIVEDVGGNMNAYTSRELTSYHIHLLKNDSGLALDILADIYQNAVMPEEEMERERHVILQEIGMCNDTPDELVFDNYYEAAYPGQTVGAPILGKAADISGMKRSALSDYIRRYYTPPRTVISAAGNLDHQDFVAKVESMFRNLPPAQADSQPAANYKGGEVRADKELEQSHIVLGFEGVSRLSPDYYTAQVLSTLLGGGMSSRLFQEVREKRGLVYSIYSFHSGYIDSGQFAIYAGTGPDDLKKLVPVVCDEVRNVCENVTVAELERAKAQIRSGILIGQESMMTRADQQAKYLIYRHQPVDIGGIIHAIDSVDTASVCEVAQKIFSSRPTISALGPLKNLESYEKIEKRLRA